MRLEGRPGKPPRRPSPFQGSKHCGSERGRGDEAGKEQSATPRDGLRAAAQGPGAAALPGLVETEEEKRRAEENGSLERTPGPTKRRAGLRERPPRPGQKRIKPPSVLKSNVKVSRRGAVYPPMPSASRETCALAAPLSLSYAARVRAGARIGLPTEGGGHRSLKSRCKRSGPRPSPVPMTTLARRHVDQDVVMREGSFPAKPNGQAAGC